MLKENDLQSKFYYPYCKNSQCDGVLKIKINDNFTINYECDKNPNHKGENIYFKTFENFYLKEKEISKCSNCNLNLENDYEYNCKNCDKIYCPNCFLFDKHIKENNKNLIIKNKKCKIHNKEISRYCIDCKINLCNYCVKLNTNNNNLHINHNIKNLSTFMPSNYKINKLKNKIEDNSKYCDKIIYSLNIIQKLINNKIDGLKRNLKNEIELYKKMIFNFNPFFINYTYYLDFYYINKNIENYKKKLEIFNDCSNFQDKINSLMKLLNKNKKEGKR